ncbi:hypothetical protein [Butyrivibrio fibrisolvens]|uniref:hypothetical protein n=1 Tax=Butyrivibrio fibrisolvens TaxID=831 RepID=UPI0003B57E04|nr:hypothetical protein [Butyrivibrio fibrisolvens]
MNDAENSINTEPSFEDIINNLDGIICAIMTDSSGNNVILERQFDALKPSISLRSKYIQLDINGTHSQLHELNEIIKNYDKRSTNAVKEEGDMPAIAFEIYLEKFKAKYKVLLMHPIFWGLVADEPDERANTIRLIFDSEYVGVFDTGISNFDALDAEAEAQAQRDIAILKGAEEDEKRAQRRKEYYDGTLFTSDDEEEDYYDLIDSNEDKK